MVLSTDRNLNRIYQTALKLVFQDPVILLLFLFLFVLDAAALAVLYLAPSEPFSYIVAPIIRTFWTERFLHYPDNFILLPKLFNLAHFVLSASFGVFVTAVVIKKFEAFYNGKRLSTISACGSVLKRYIGLFLSWVAAYSAFSFFAERLLMAIPNMPALQLPIAFLSAVILQALFAYLLPALLLEEKKIFSRLMSAFTFAAKHFLFTVMLIAIPILVIVAVSFAKAFSPYLIRIYPEAVLWILMASIFFSLIVDVILTASTTVFYLEARNTHK